LREVEEIEDLPLRQLVEPVLGEQGISQTDVNAIETLESYMMSKTWRSLLLKQARQYYSAL